jgi:hypothetical protein
MRAVLVVLALVVTACSNASSPEATATGPSGQAVPPGLDWTAELVGGGTLDGRSLAGGDVALWFWAPW